MAPYNNAIVVVIAFVVLPSMVLAQTNYAVGDSSGWGQSSVDYQAWANGITLYVGDSLGEYLTGYCKFAAFMITPASFEENENEKLNSLN